MCVSFINLFQDNLLYLDLCRTKLLVKLHVMFCGCSSLLALPCSLTVLGTVVSVHIDAGGWSERLCELQQHSPLQNREKKTCIGWLIQQASLEEILRVLQRLILCKILKSSRVKAITELSSIRTPLFIILPSHPLVWVLYYFSLTV